MSPHDVSDESVDGLERFPSGQREQTVNLPAYAFEGSNPSLSTSRREAGMIGVAGQDVRGNSSVGRASAFQAEGRGFESRFPLHRQESELGRNERDARSGPCSSVGRARPW